MTSRKSKILVIQAVLVLSVQGARTEAGMMSHRLVGTQGIMSQHYHIDDEGYEPRNQALPYDYQEGPSAAHFSSDRRYRCYTWSVEKREHQQRCSGS